MISALALFLVPFLSGMMVWRIQPKSRSKIKLLLAFSGAYLLALSLFHLVPEVYEAEPKLGGLFILFGFIVQLLLEFLSGGIEHGHFHFHSKSEKHFPLTLIISLVLHTFLECLPLARQETSGLFDGASIVVGISIHNIPVAITLMSVLIQSGLNRNTVWGSLLLFAISGPLGYLVGYWGGDYFTSLSPHFFQLAMGLVIGIFLHVSTTILFESGEGHRFNLYKLGSILIGGGLAYVSLS